MQLILVPGEGKGLAFILAKMPSSIKFTSAPPSSNTRTGEPFTWRSQVAKPVGTSNARVRIAAVRGGFSFPAFAALTVG